MTRFWANKVSSSHFSMVEAVPPTKGILLKIDLVIEQGSEMYILVIVHFPLIHSPLAEHLVPWVFQNASAASSVEKHLMLASPQFLTPMQYFFWDLALANI